jgi:hypothetical protein
MVQDYSRSIQYDGLGPLYHVYMFKAPGEIFVQYNIGLLSTDAEDNVNHNLA